MSISKISHADPTLIAFAFSGSLSRDDVNAMADSLNHAFDATEDAKVLLDFRALLNIDADAMASLQATKAQVRSLGNVARYAVIDPPDTAGRMIEVFDKLIPIDARVFAADQSESAWRFVERD